MDTPRQVAGSLLRASIAAVLLSAPSSSAIAENAILVSTAKGLDDALERARAGDTILLSPGEYGRLQTSATFERAVTIRSANPKDPARLAGLRFVRAKNLAFEDLDIGRPRRGEPDGASVVEISDSSEIAIKNSRVHGSSDNNPTDELTGLTARNVIKLRIENVSFQNLGLGAILYSLSDADFIRNSFRFIQSDGIDMASVIRTRIVGNEFSDFFPEESDHPDAIQCWTRGQTSGCVDIVISDNLIRSHPDRRVQGIFFGDEIDLWRFGRGHRRITVKRNLIVSTLWHAIYFYYPAELLLEDNTVLNEPGGPLVPGGPVRPWIMVTGEGAYLKGNRAPSFRVGAATEPPPNNSYFGAEKPSRIDNLLREWRSIREGM